MKNGIFMTKLPMYLYHFTSSESVIKILENGKFLPSKIISSNDPFDVDWTSFSDTYFKNDNEIREFVTQVITHAMRRQSNSLLPKLPDGYSSFTAHQKKVFSHQIFLCIKNSLSKDGLFHETRLDGKLSNYRESSYVYCFSSTDIGYSMPLWSHYADNHTGIVLQFALRDSKYNDDVYEVKYKNRKNLRGGILNYKEARDSLIQFNDDEFIKYCFQKILLSKSKHWKYENEWRIIDFDAKSHPYIEVNDSLITAIYLGLNITETDKAKISKLVSDKYSGMKIFIAEKDTRYIKFNFMPI